MTDEKKDQAPPTGDTGAPSDERPADADATQLPPIDFSTFVISLNSSALVQLGILEEPGTGQKTKNLALAKQTIDILGILEEKISQLGGTTVGYWPTEGYDHDESQAERNGKFVGLALDEVNQSEQSADRIAEWVAQLKREFGV